MRKRTRLSVGRKSFELHDDDYDSGIFLEWS